MSTIPASALAELFDLLAKDKVMQIASKYGIKLSDVALESAE
jgi:cell division protein FtsL